ncbi:MAG: hypothetical protein ABR936_15485 [Bacteroidota bacterium]|jgi:hypothetical protein
MIRFKNPDSEPNIKRIDTKPNAKKQTHGFQVHFERGDDNYTKLFSDRKCGSKEVARVKAREFRLVLEKSIPPETIQFDRKRMVTNRSGVIGVSFTETPLADGTSIPYASTTVRIRKNKAVTKKFRIVDGNIKLAVEQAHAWRDFLIQERIKAEQK